jgi:glycosyltransferase involved in cell wall biosynthesis
VGDGPKRAALETQAHSLDVGNAVTFAGNRSDVIDLLRSADLFLFPSESEGLSNAVIEACLARLPIVACSISGVADIVRDGEEALLVPPRSPMRLVAAVETCLWKAVLAEKLAGAAQRCALDNYGLEHFLTRLYDAYDNALAYRGTSSE